MVSMKKSTKTLFNIIAVSIILAILIFLEMNKRKFSYDISIIERSMIYAVAAVAMNLTNGFTGLFSLGQAGFMAIGAYTVALLTIPVEARAGVFYVTGMNEFLSKIELPFIPALLLGGLFAAILAGLIGIPVLRLKSDYLAIATLGFSEIIRSIIASPQLNMITNGSYGLKKIPRFSSIFVPIALCCLCILIIVLLINSSYGRAFKAIREDETAAEAMGINLFKHKLTSFMISSFFTGVAGGLLASYMGTIDSGTFKITLTYDILLIVVLGGMGSVTGSILGSFLVTAGREWLRFFDQPLKVGSWQVPLFRTGFRMVVFSVLLMVVVLFYSKGLMGSKEFSWEGLVRFFKNLFTRKQKLNGGVSNGK
ncbi:MAG: branched-chain amino acid ABC transporter permease [Flexilinea flocculi]|nr:branched-chain amino acid ABC transporter permease [Flexilinea flocculi]